MSRVITTEVFTFDELSEGAKEKAVQNWKWNNAEWVGEHDAMKTLKAFEQVFPVKVKNYEITGSGYGYSRAETEIDEMIEVQDLEGIRLISYLYNNFYYQATKGRYYSLWSKKDFNNERMPSMGDLKQRHSKVMREQGACPFTGYYMDDSILQPFYEAVNGERIHTGDTFEDIMRECISEWVKACVNDIDEEESYEHIAEILEINDYEFTEDGERV